VTAQETQLVFLLYVVAIFVLRDPSLRHYEELLIFLRVFRELGYGSGNRPRFPPFLHSSFSFTYLLSLSPVTIALENVELFEVFKQA